MEFDLELLKSDPFKWMDTRNMTIGNFNLNLFQKHHRLQKTALALSVLALGCWVAFGFDSCIGQPMMVIHSLPDFLMGKITFEGLTQVWANAYGKEFHYSAVVIYGLCYYFLSRHFDKNGITGFKNVAYACGLTWVSIGLFELYWMGSYSYFQVQPWVLTFQFPQLRIILQNLVFLLGAGFLVILYMFVDSCILDKKGDVVGRTWKFRWNWVSYALIGASVATAVLWWYYPLQSPQISVAYETGEVWTNSQMFPQTLYTVDVNPTDSVNAGVWFWVQNDMVHGLNTVVKVLFTLAVFNIGLIRKVKP